MCIRDRGNPGKAVLDNVAKPVVLVPLRTISRFVNIPEYLMYRMTGGFASDYTYGSRSNLMNLRERRWDPRLLELFGIKSEELCPLLEPGSVVGTVNKEFCLLYTSRCV